MTSKQKESRELQSVEKWKKSQRKNLLKSIDTLTIIPMDLTVKIAVKGQRKQFTTKHSVFSPLTMLRKSWKMKKKISIN